MKLRLLIVAALAMLPVAARAEAFSITAIIAWLGEAALSYGGATLMTWGQVIFTTVMTAYGSVTARRAARKAAASARAAYKDSLADRSVTVLRTDPPWQVVYGRAIVGGAIVDIFSTDKVTNTREDGSALTRTDGLKHLVIAVAAHECQAINEVFVDGVALGPLDGNGRPTSGEFYKARTATRTVTFTNSITPAEQPIAVLQAYSGAWNIPGDTGVNTDAQPQTVTISGASLNGPAGVQVRVDFTVDDHSAPIRVSKHLGADAQTTSAYLSSLDATRYTANHRLRGICYVVVTLDMEEPRFQGGPPNITFDVSGRKLYDPRSTLTAYSENPALIIRDFLTAPWGFGATTADIDDTSVITAANACDARLSASVQSYAATFTADPATNLIAFASDRALATGDGVRVSTSTTLPAPLAAGTTYYVIAGTSKTVFGLASSLANAVAGTAIDITTAGTGTHTCTWYDYAAYTCNGSFTTDASPEATLEDLTECMAGSVTYGAKWSLLAGAWTASVLSLVDDDLHGQIEVVQTDTSMADLFNGVHGQFIARATATPTDANPYQNATFVSADGRELWTNLDLPYTDNLVRARNLARIFVERNRSGQVIRYPAKLKAWPVQVGDRVTVTSTEYALSAKTYRCTDWQFEITGAVVLTLQEDDATIYDLADAAVADPTPNTDLPNPWNVAIMANLQATSGTATLLRSVDGSIVPRVSVTWNAVTDGSVINGGAIQVGWRELGATAWQIVEVSGQTTQAYINDVIEGQPLTIAVRARNVLGAVGAPIFVAHLVVGKSAAPSNVAGLTATTVAATVEIKWTPSADLDYSVTRLRYGGTYAGGTLLWEGAGSSATVRFPSDNTYTVWAVHEDTTGHVSAAPASVSATYNSTGSSSTNSAAVFLYRRTATGSAPGVTTTGNITYTFATGALTGTIPTSWTAAVPGGTGYLWSIQQVFSAAAASATNANTGWSSPAQVAQDGAAGSNGTDSTSYWLLASAASVQKNISNAFTPTTITLSGKSQAGAGAVGAYAGRFTVERSTDGTTYLAATAGSPNYGYTSAGNESSTAYTVTDSATKLIRLRLYLAGGTTTLLDELVVPVVSDGATGSTGSTGSTGANAQTLQLVATGFGFVFADVSATTSASPTISFDALLQNVGGTATFTATAYNASDASLGTITLGGSGNTGRTLTSTQFNSLGALTTRYVKVVAALSGLSDSTTIYRADEGADAVQAVLSNEAHTLPAANDGTVSSYVGSGTTIRVFEGTTELDFDGVGTAAGKWTATRAVTTGTVSSPGGISESVLQAVVADHAGMSTDVATITYTITGKTATGASFSIAKVQTLTKSKTGITGTTGNSVAMVELYQRTYTEAAPASAPNATITYNFADGSITGTPGNNWTRAVPSTGGEYLWVITAQASSTSATDTIGTGEWSWPPVLLSSARKPVIGYSSQFDIRASAWDTVGKELANRVVMDIITTDTLKTQLASTTHLVRGDTVTLSNTSPWIETTGAYNAGTTYYPGDVAIDTTSTPKKAYRCIKQSLANAFSDPVYWVIYRASVISKTWAANTLFDADDYVTQNNRDAVSTIFMAEFKHTSPVSSVWADERDGGGFAEMRYWDGTAWLRPGMVVDGNLLVRGSVDAEAMNVRKLSSITADLGNITAGNLDLNGWIKVKAYTSLTFTDEIGNVTSNVAASFNTSNAAAWGGIGFTSDANGAGIYGRNTSTSAGSVAVKGVGVVAGKFDSSSSTGTAVRAVGYADGHSTNPSYGLHATATGAGAAIYAQGNQNLSTVRAKALLINGKTETDNEIKSTLSSGAPFVVASTTMVANLNVEKHGGFSVAASGTWWNGIPSIDGSGVFEGPKYFDFHGASGDTTIDYGARLYLSGGASTGAGYLRVIQHDGASANVDQYLLAGVNEAGALGTALTGSNGPTTGPASYSLKWIRGNLGGTQIWIPYLS